MIVAFLESSGYCYTCSKEVTFSSGTSWLRDNYLCSNCGSIPRERALMCVIEQYYPNWRDLVIHESSPAARGASARMRSECRQYIGSQYWPSIPEGSENKGVRCENIERLTFPDESVDLNITQDVMEHIFHPANAFKEICRTLRLGGAHIFTVPLVQKHQPSRRRARLAQSGEIIHLHPAQYHGNPVSAEGALVTVDWGFDICSHIFNATGHPTHLIKIDDLSKGIRADYIEVLVSTKSKNMIPGEV